MTMTRFRKIRRQRSLLQDVYKRQILYDVNVLKIIHFKKRQQFNAGRAAELFPFPKIKENERTAAPPGRIVRGADVYKRQTQNWMWVYLTDEFSGSPQMVLFDYERTRAGYHPVTF